MYQTQKSLPTGQTLTCPDCGSNRFRYGRGKVECTNCGWSHGGNASNKFGAKRTEYAGRKYDSKYEASVAQELDLRLKGGDILEVIPQFKVEIHSHRPDGQLAFITYHKVDFRIKLRDGSYELIEAKGVETEDYRWRRKLLEQIWLPMHPDHTYRVVKQSATGFRKRR